MFQYPQEIASGFKAIAPKSRAYYAKRLRRMRAARDKCSRQYLLAVTHGYNQCFAQAIQLHRGKPLREVFYKRA